MARFRRDAEAHDGHHYAVRYESLLDDAAGEMQRLFRWFGCDASEATVAAVVGRNAFAVASGRRHPGEPDPTPFTLQGIAGDWTNHIYSACNRRSRATPHKRR